MTRSSTKPTTGSAANGPAKETPKRKVRLPKNKASASPTKPAFSAHDKVYVVGVASGIMLAWCENKAYTDGTPAFTRDIEGKLHEAGEEGLQQCNITFMAQRVDPGDPHKPRAFRRHKRDGTINPDPTQTLLETVMVRILENPQDNTETNRAMWGQNIATIWTALSSYERTFEFTADLTPTSGLLDHAGCRWITSRDAITAAQCMHDGISMDQVLETDAFMAEVFPLDSVSTIRQFYNRPPAFQLGSNPIETNGTPQTPQQALQGVLSSLKLHKLP
jgi:hypothetical protein